MGRDITRPAKPVTYVPVKGSAVKLDPFEHLFQHVKQSDPMLYEALKRLSRYAIQVQEFIDTPVEETPVAAGSGELKATFGLLKPLVILPALTNYFICRTGGTFDNVALKNKVAPDSSTNSLDTILDICISTDDGTTFTSIFSSSAKLTIPNTSTATIILTGVFGITSIAEGDLLRIDCTQVAVPNPGSDIEVVLQWV